MLKKLAVLAAASAALFAASVQAAPVMYEAILSGLNETPPVASPGSGIALVTVDDDDMMRVQVTWSGLTAPVTAAHIHCCFVGGTPGTFVVATPTPSFPGFPTGTSGSYDMTFDLDLPSSYRAGFITVAGGLGAAKAQLLGALDAGTAYLNIHTQNFLGGEIRGNLLLVPEPATAMLGLAALAAAGAASRRRREPLPA